MPGWTSVTSATAPARGGDPDGQRAAYVQFLRGGCAKPVVGAANATAVGGGLELLLGCDLVVASEQAEFGLPEVKRGLFAGGGGVRLGRVIPLAIALEIGLTGDRIDAERALSFGLINRVVPADQSPRRGGRAREPRSRRTDPLGVQATKKLMHDALDVDPEELWERQRALNASVFGSDDAKRALAPSSRSANRTGRATRTKRSAGTAPRPSRPSGSTAPRAPRRREVPRPREAQRQGPDLLDDVHGAGERARPRVRLRCRVDRRPLNVWRYRLEPTGDGTDVTESFELAETAMLRLYWALFGGPGSNEPQRHADDARAHQGRGRIARLSARFVPALVRALHVEQTSRVVDEHGVDLGVAEPGIPERGQHVLGDVAVVPRAERAAALRKPVVVTRRVV